MPRMVAATPLADFPTKLRMIEGIDISDEAKITGMTPAVLTFSGMLDDCPATILLPWTFFAYCTGIFRTASLSRIVRATVKRMTTAIMTAAIPPFAIDFPLTNCCQSAVMSCGSLETILIRRTIEIPFPTPFSVIRSPIHMTNVDPAVNAKITVITLRKL